MKNVKSIRFKTMEKKTRKKSDKVYLHAQQRVKALRKKDTSSNSLFTSFVLACTYKQCRKSKCLF